MDELGVGMINVYCQYKIIAYNTLKSYFKPMEMGSFKLHPMRSLVHILIIKIYCGWEVFLSHKLNDLMFEVNYNEWQFERS